MRRVSASDDLVKSLTSAVAPSQSDLDAWIWDEDEILVTRGAAVGLARRTLHPGRVWLAIARSDDAKPGEIAELIAAARRQAGKPLKLRTSDLGLVALLEATGARRVIASHLVSIDAARSGTKRWLADVVRPVALTERNIDDPVLCDAVWKLYGRIHGWDPVASDAVLPGSLCADVAIAATLDGPTGDPFAVVCAHHGSPLEAAFVGTLDDRADEAATTAGLLAWLLDRCGRLDVEADDGDGAHPTLVSVLRSIPDAEWADPVHFVEWT